MFLIVSNSSSVYSVLLGSDFSKTNNPGLILTLSTSGEWDATSTLLENENLIENKFNDLPYLKFNAHFL